MYYIMYTDWRISRIRIRIYSNYSINLRATKVKLWHLMFWTH